MTVGVSAGLTAAARPAAANIISVTSVSGGIGGPGCTLRDAITAANTDTATGGCQGGGPTDTIVLPLAATITLTVVDNSTDGETGLPVVTTTIIINGNGSTVERSSAAGTPIFRIFDVSDTGDLTLNDLAIANGLTAIHSKGDPGGGILNAGTLTLNNCTVSGNATGDGSDGNSGGDGGDGGGIFNGGTLTMTGCTVSGNTTGNGGNGSASGGGGGDGGDGGDGGGIANEGTANLNNCTISGNTTGHGGDGTRNGGEGGDGGGIVTDGTVGLANCTITQNTAGNGGIGTNTNGHGGAGGGVAQEDEPVYLKNTILGLNSIAGTGKGPDCSGTLTSKGYNLIQHTLDCTFVPITGDITLQLPKLEPLANNGGPTQTHALMSDSMAVDSGNPAGCTDTGDNLFTTDQRGAPRPVDGGSGRGDNCDIGAYEFGALLPNGALCTANKQCASGQCEGVCVSPVQVPAVSPGMLLLMAVFLSAWGGLRARPAVPRR
jgi:hypothetical protein